MKKIVNSILLFITNCLHRSYRSPEVRHWFSVNGDKTLRLDYDLDHHSIVFDCGGYEGQWTSDIYAKYSCNIYIFEPVPHFVENIRRRFAKNPHIHTYEFGLSSKTCISKIFLSGDGSSIFKKDNNKGRALTNEIKLIKITDFIAEQKIKKIDLMKINIEGGEYELLEHLIESGFIGKIGNIQVQFHDFIPNAKERMLAIQNALSKTHELTYQYVFVWENWQLKPNNA